MSLTAKDLNVRREWAIREFRYWKDDIATADAIYNDQWSVALGDDWVEESEPLVENIYSQAVEDKALTAGIVLPVLKVPPKRGTRADRGERSAQVRRRVMMSTWERSKVSRNLPVWFMNLFHTGAMYTIPWTNWMAMNGAPNPSNKRFPFIMKVNARNVYPLGHDPIGTLNEAMVITRRRKLEIEQEYGVGALDMFRRGRSEPDDWFEETWYMNEREWGVAFGDPQMGSGDDFYRTDLDTVNESNSLAMEWIREPEPHLLPGCPITEAKWPTVDARYRGPVMDVIPTMKTANTFMKRLLDDLSANIFAPVVADNIENIDEWGPGAIMVGDGQGPANITHARAPVNFEAQQVIGQLVEQARHQAMEPAQRAGDPQASIVSGKGTTSLLGAFNMELAVAQREMTHLLQRSTAMTAALDELWCAGPKQIIGVDEGADFEETYDAAAVFDGDYRNIVTYAERSGLDANQHLTTIATMRNMEGFSLRTFMEKSGLVDNPLQEERTIAIENLSKLFYAAILPQQIEAGNIQLIQEFIEAIDDDKMTVNQAVLDAIKKSQPTGQPQGPGGVPGGPGAPPDTVREQRSLASGGIPGNAEGLPPPPGADLLSLLPGNVGRQIAETGPGRTAA